MNKRSIFYGCLLFGWLCLPTIGTMATASELVYQPVNPAFGGSPSNAPMLLNEANAQNNFGPPTKDPLATFNDSLSRQILNRLSSKIVDAAFGGTTGLQPGHYQMGNYSVDVTADADGLGFTVTIVDMTNNNQTTVQVPYQ